MQFGGHRCVSVLREDGAEPASEIIMLAGCELDDAKQEKFCMAAIGKKRLEEDVSHRIAILSRVS